MGESLCSGLGIPRFDQLSLAVASNNGLLVAANDVALVKARVPLKLAENLAGMNIPCLHGSVSPNAKGDLSSWIDVNPGN